MKDMSKYVRVENVYIWFEAFLVGLSNYIEDAKPETLAYYDGDRLITLGKMIKSKINSTKIQSPSYAPRERDADTDVACPRSGDPGARRWYVDLRP